MLHLAERGTRQLFDKNELARHLEAGELGLRVGFQAVRIDSTIRTPDHIGHRHLLPFRIGMADHAGVDDLGMFEQHALDFRRIDVLAAGNDHVLLAVVDPEIAVGVAAADVAGPIPAVVQRLAGCFLVAPVFEEHVGTTNRDFADGVRGDFIAGLIDHLGLAAQPRQPGRTGPRIIAAEPGINGNGAGLGRTIDLQHRHAALCDAVDQMLRHDGRAGGDGLERGQIGRSPGRVIRHRLDGRRHQHRQRRPVAGDRGQRRVGGEAGMDGHGRAVMQRRRGLDVQPADVKERQHGQHVVVGTEPMHVLAHDAVPEQRLLAQHRALGSPGGAGGVDDQQRTGHVGVRIAAVTRGSRQQGVQRRALGWRKIEADGVGIRQGFRKRWENFRERRFEHQHLGGGVRENEQLFGDRQPPVQRHQHGAEPGAGVEQHQVVRTVEAENGDTVASADVALRLERARGAFDSRREIAVAQNLAGKDRRRLVGREGGVALDEGRQVQDQ